MKFSLFILAVIVASGVPAQDPGQPIQEEIQPAIVVDQDVVEVMDDFLMNKGLIEGLNKKSNGDVFFVATGYGAVASMPGGKNYIVARNAAFGKAMILTKEAMSEYMSVEIERAAGYELIEGILPEEVATAVQEAKTNPTLTEDYVEVVSAATKASLCGLQVYKAFEVMRSGKETQIGVIAIYSKKLAQTAVAMTGGNVNCGPFPKKKPVREQLPQDSSILLCTFGCQQLVDEDGQPVLVSYGQAPDGRAGYKKAKMAAMSQMRAFAGEMAVAKSVYETSSSIEEFADAGTVYNNDESFQQLVNTTSKSLEMNGIATVKKWRATHPETGQKVAGTVIAWTPDMSKNAKKMKTDVEEMKKAAPEATTEKVDSDNAGQHGTADAIKSGSSADDDAF